MEEKETEVGEKEPERDLLIQIGENLSDQKSFSGELDSEQKIGIAKRWLSSNRESVENVLQKIDTKPSGSTTVVAALADVLFLYFGGAIPAILIAKLVLQYGLNSVISNSSELEVTDENINGTKRRLEDRGQERKLRFESDVEFDFENLASRRHVSRHQIDTTNSLTLTFGGLKNQEDREFVEQYMRAFNELKSSLSTRS